MKNIIKFILAIVLISMSLVKGFSQDNIYGDQLLYDFDKDISLDLESASLLDVLKMFSQQTGLNFISTESVQDRELTLYIEKVPLKEAMDIIFKANNLGYDYYPDSNMFVVKEMGKIALELKSKVYRLKYARLTMSRIQQEINDVMETTTGGVGRKVGIVEAIKIVLSEVGKITEDPQTNSLVVVDVPVQFAMIDEIVAKLDIPTPRVMIEVEMMDVSKSHFDKLGFNWLNGATANFSGPSRQTAFPFPTHLTPSGATLARTFELGTLSFEALTVTMNFLIQDTTTKFIARPKIITLSNETAEVNLTVDEAIGLTTTVDNGVETQTVERDQTGTKLRVTPQVNLASRDITLFIEMFNREATSSNLSVSSLSGAIKNVEERGTKSVVRLQDGETLYIGGLIKKEMSKIEKKIPFLGDIPIVGRFFRYKNAPEGDNSERELLVFLTPRIMPERGTRVVKKSIGVFKREQQNDAKSKSIKLTLDSFNR